MTKHIFITDHIVTYTCLLDYFKLLTILTPSLHLINCLIETLLFSFLIVLLIRYIVRIPGYFLCFVKCLLLFYSGLQTKSFLLEIGHLLYLLKVLILSYRFHLFLPLPFCCCWQVACFTSSFGCGLHIKPLRAGVLS